MSRILFANNEFHLRSLFREVLRGLRKICDETPVLTPKSEYPIELQREIKKASINKIQYRDYLLSEIRHAIFQKFSGTCKYVKDQTLYSQLSQGHSLVSKLSAIHREPANDETWVGLITLVIEERTAQLRKSKWAFDYKKHKQVIDESHLKELHPLQAKRVLAKQRKIFDNLSVNTDKGFKKLLAKSEENASWVVRNYLKTLQLEGKIPNPYKLPYVSHTMRQQGMQMPKMVNIIPGSTKSAVLKAAYDMDYVNSVIKSEIEYLVNKKQYLEKYQQIVNKKGPVKVQIRSTLAGIMQVHFLRSLVKDKDRMKQIAIDIKNLTRIKRKQLIWNFDPTKSDGVTERKFGDGFAVRGSKGYSIDEVMFPKKFYEKLVLEEAAWECLIKAEELKSVYGQNVLHNADVADQFVKVREANSRSWLEPLETASKVIDAEVKLFFAKYRITDSSPIWDRRAALQEQMNKIYETTSSRFEKLMELLKNNNVHKHSDLFHRHHHSMVCHGNKMPEKQRTGAGKSLGDYIEEVGLKGFKLGYEIKKRL